MRDRPTVDWLGHIADIPSRIAIGILSGMTAAFLAMCICVTVWSIALIVFRVDLEYSEQILHAVLPWLTGSFVGLGFFGGLLSDEDYYLVDIPARIGNGIVGGMSGAIVSTVACCAWWAVLLAVFRLDFEYSEQILRAVLPWLAGSFFGVGFFSGLTSDEDCPFPTRY